MELGVFLRCAGWAVAALRKRGIADFMGLLGHLLWLFGHLGSSPRRGAATRTIKLPFYAFIQILSATNRLDSNIRGYL
jgi:hypothetical protein